jgi:membrane protease YdiL (CAAX protease family)
MPAAESLAILRDVFVWAVIALAVALVVYAMARRWCDIAWNVEGNVLTRPYGMPDAVVGVFLLVLLGAGFFAAPEDAAGSGGESAVGVVTIETLLLNVLSMLMLCMIVLVHLRFIRGLNPGELFGVRQLPVRRALLYAVGALIVTVVVGGFAMWALLTWNEGALPDSSSQEAIKAFEKEGSLAFRIMLGFVAVVTAPLMEELIFRGFLYGVIKRGTDRWFAAVFTAMIFAVVHSHVGSLPQLFLLGLGLAIAYEQTGCLLVPIFMHAMFNGWNIAMLVIATSTT